MRRKSAPTPAALSPTSQSPPTPSPAMGKGMAPPSPSPASAVRTDVRLSGKVLKKNPGFLRQWRPRSMIVTSDGFLRYEKKKGDNSRVKETDLLKAEIAPNLTLQSSHYCISITTGTKPFLLGFVSKSEATLWQEVILEVADDNAAGRRAWVAQLKHVLTLTLRDRRACVEQMGERDWLSEWQFCWKSLRNRRDEDFNSRRRRLKRLYTIWLQFHLFAEVVAEIHFATVQSRDEYRTPSSQETSRQPSDTQISDNRSNHSSNSLAESVSAWPTAASMSMKVVNVNEDVDVIHMKTIKLEYGSKTWRGDKRLLKQTADFATFRQTLDEMVVQHGLHDAMAKFPLFPLVAAFSIRGTNVVVTAQSLSQNTEVVQVDKRDLNELVGALRLAGSLSKFTFGEIPDLWVRRARGGTQEGELVHVSSRYDDVLQQSLRSSMVHGVLLRAGHQSIEVLSSHDVDELVQDKTSRWTPYLDLLYYQLDPSEGAIDNQSAKQFLLKRPRSVSCKGDIVFAIDASQCRLQLDLKEAFVQRYQIEVLPVLRRLQEVKHSSDQMRVGIHALGAAASATDPTAAIVGELEQTIKNYLRRHTRDIATKLITLGDEVASTLPNNSLGRVDRAILTAPLSRQHSQDLNGGSFRQQRRSSVDSNAAIGDQGGVAASASIYIIDATHLRRELKRLGVNMRLLPLAFAYLSAKRQPGVQVLLASEIVARIAKTLFQFRLSHDQNADKSRWRSRKSRLIDFIGQIMRGVHDDENHSQFWRIDAPIWFLLGPFASSIALAEYGMIQPATVLESYRYHIRSNSSVLFNCLLQSFKAHLTDGYLPAVDETRWASLPFLRREGQLAFLDEAFDPKLALTYHSAWLSASAHSFRSHFENLQRLFTDGGGKMTPKSEIHSAKLFFDSLRGQFRQSVAFATETRLEGALLALETRQAACSFVHDAHSALLDYRLDTARDLVRQACDLVVTSGAQSSFPLELKVSLLVIAALSDRETLLSPRTKKPSTPSISPWTTVQTWLQHFYRGSSFCHVLPSICPHPLAEAIRELIGSGRTRAVSSSMSRNDGDTPLPTSLRTKIERVVELDLWEYLAPAVDKQRHLTGGTRGNATIGVFPSRTNSMPLQKSLIHPLESTDAARRSLSDHANLFATQGNGTAGSHAMMELAGSLAMSSYDRVLRTLEHYFLPVLNETKNSCWLLPGYLFDATRAQQARFPPPPPLRESMPAPGVALMWGRSTGLSLDEEAKLSNKLVDGIGCRPRHVLDIGILELPLPTRRVVQVSCGYRHTALLTADDRQLYTFGYGECGRLGHGDEQSVDSPKRVEFFDNLAESLGGPHIAGVRQVACGREHTMVVLVNGELFGFGWAEAGRLGTGESGSVPHPSKVVSLKDVEAVACGREHTLALCKSGEVYSCGAGFGGRLGSGGENDEELPVCVVGLADEVVVSIDAGECHSSALTKDGDVFTWGFGSSGALGHGSRENALVPTKVVGPWMESKMDERIEGVSCGSYHSLAYTTHGVLYGWGDSAAGQLGDKLVDAPEMVVLSPQQLKLPRSATFQDDRRGANNQQRIQGVACGTFTSAASTLDGKVFVWGSAAAGNGAKLDRDDAKLKQVSVVSDFAIGQISCGAYHTVVLTHSPVFN